MPTTQQRPMASCSAKYPLSLLCHDFRASGEFALGPSMLLRCAREAWLPLLFAGETRRQARGVKKLLRKDLAGSHTEGSCSRVHLSHDEKTARSLRGLQKQAETTSSNKSQLRVQSRDRVKSFQYPVGSTAVLRFPAHLVIPSGVEAVGFLSGIFMFMCRIEP